MYDRARTAYYNNDTSEFDYWKLGAIGFLASYNGRFYDGGYSKSGYEKTKNGLRYRDYYRESKDNLLKQAPLLRGIEFHCSDYRSFDGYAKDFDGKHKALIYCDPPYANTKKFANSQNFDYDDFWETMRHWSKIGSIVYISELQAPDDFECVWEQSVSRSIKATDKSRAVERLFKYKE